MLHVFFSWSASVDKTTPSLTTTQHHNNNKDNQPVWSMLARCNTMNFDESSDMVIDKR